MENDVNYSRLVLLLCCFLSHASHVTGQTPVLSPKSFDEHFAQDVKPVSGDVVTGIHGGDSEKPAGDNLTVLIPAGAWRELRVTITALDGSYDARVLYDLNSVRSGPTRLRIPTKNSTLFQKASKESLSVLAEISDGLKTTATVLAGWGIDGHRRRVRAYLNSRGWDTRIYISSPATGNLDPGDCASVAAPNVVAYDTTCVVDIPGGATRFEVALIRFRFEQRAKDIRIPVQVP